VGGPEALSGVDVSHEESDRIGADIDRSDADCALRWTRRGANPRRDKEERRQPWVDGGNGGTVA
jgi:hypothetical protein